MCPTRPPLTEVSSVSEGQGGPVTTGHSGSVEEVGVSAVMAKVAGLRPWISGAGFVGAEHPQVGAHKDQLRHLPC